MDRIVKGLLIPILLFSMLGCKPSTEPNMSPFAATATGPAPSIPAGQKTGVVWDGVTPGGTTPDALLPTKMQKELLRPNGAGNETTFDYQTPVSSYHWDKLVDVTADDDDTFVANMNGDPGAWQRDLYAMDDHSFGSGIIHRVTVYLRTANSEPGAKIVILTNGVIFEQPVKGDSSWTTNSYTWDKNPSTKKSWTWAEIDALDIGTSLAGSNVSVNQTNQYPPQLNVAPNAPPPPYPVPVPPYPVTPGRPRATQLYTEVEYSNSVVYEIIRPDGDGNVTAFGSQYPASGSHWDKVADEVPDEDSTFIENPGYDRGAYQRDLFALQNHSRGSGTVSSLTVYIRVKTNASGNRIVIRTNNTTIEQPLALGYAYWATLYYTWATNPATNESWTWDEVDALEAGVALAGTNAGPHWARCTQVYAMVGYEPVNAPSGPVNPDVPNIPSNTFSYRAGEAVLPANVSTMTVTFNTPLSNADYSVSLTLENAVLPSNTYLSLSSRSARSFNVSLLSAGQPVTAHGDITFLWTAIPFNNPFPPLVLTETLRPNGPGNETSIDTQYPPAGEHWQKVAGVNPDEDASYLENKRGSGIPTYPFVEDKTSIPGAWQRDLFALHDHSLGSGTVTGVTVFIRTKHNASYAQAAILTHDTVFEPGLVTNPGYVTNSYTWTVNPSTGKPWTWAEIDDLQIGVSLYSSVDVNPDWSRCTQEYAVVSYIPDNLAVLGETLRPNGTGSVTSIDSQYPATGAHWQKVAEVTPDEDAAYIENKNGTGPTWQRDLFSMQYHSKGTDDITGVTVYIRTKLNASTAQIAIRTYGLVYEPVISLTVPEYVTDNYTWTVNPYTGKPWTWAEIDDMEIGVSLYSSTANPDWSRCTQVYAVVSYVQRGN